MSFYLKVRKETINIYLIHCNMYFLQQMIPSFNNLYPKVTNSSDLFDFNAFVGGLVNK